MKFDVLANKGTYLYIYIYIWIQLANVFPKVCRQALVFPSLATNPDLHLNWPAWRTDRNCNLETQVVSRMNGRTPQGATPALPSFSLRLGLWTKSPTVGIRELTPRLVCHAKRQNLRCACFEQDSSKNADKHPLHLSKKYHYIRIIKTFVQMTHMSRQLVMFQYWSLLGSDWAVFKNLVVDCIEGVILSNCIRIVIGHYNEM